MQYAYQLKSRFSLCILHLGDAAKIIELPKIRERAKIIAKSFILLIIASYYIVLYNILITSDRSIDRSIY